MLENKSREYDRQIALLDGDLREFEEKYAMTSAEFFINFQYGKLGDEADFVEWASLYQMRQIFS